MKQNHYSGILLPDAVWQLKELGLFYRGYYYQFFMISAQAHPETCESKFYQLGAHNEQDFSTHKLRVPSINQTAPYEKKGENTVNRHELGKTWMISQGKRGGATNSPC